MSKHKRKHPSINSKITKIDGFTFEVRDGADFFIVTSPNGGMSTVPFPGPSDFMASLARQKSHAVENLRRIDATAEFLDEYYEDKR